MLVCKNTLRIRCCGAIAKAKGADGITFFVPCANIISVNKERWIRLAVLVANTITCEILTEF